MIKGQEYGISKLVIHQVDILKQAEGFNSNHLAKVLSFHIDTMKAIVENLLEERDYLKTMLTEEIANRR